MHFSGVTEESDRALSHWAIFPDTPQKFLFLFIYQCVHVMSHTCCGAQRTTFRSWLSSSILWASGIEFRSSGVVQGLWLDEPSCQTSALFFDSVSLGLTELSRLLEQQSPVSTSSVLGLWVCEMVPGFIWMTEIHTQVLLFVCWIFYPQNHLVAPICVVFKICFLRQCLSPLAQAGLQTHARPPFPTSRVRTGLRAHTATAGLC